MLTSCIDILVCLAKWRFDKTGPPHRWEPALVELLQERPGALEEPAKVALHKIRLARISHNHVLYCRPVWSQAGVGSIMLNCHFMN